MSHKFAFNHLITPKIFYKYNSLCYPYNVSHFKYQIYHSSGKWPQHIKFLLCCILRKMSNLAF